MLTLLRHLIFPSGSRSRDREMAYSAISVSVPLFTCLLLLVLSGSTVAGQGVAYHVTNKCPFPVWPAAAPNAGHPVIADGGFLLQPSQSRHVKAPATWNGRFWGRTGCDFSSGSSKGAACHTGDCQGLLACNGSIGVPPATLVEVSMQADGRKPSMYDVSLVDGYNLPVAISARPPDRNCSIAGCAKNLNSACPQELQVVSAAGGGVVACKSACLAFDLDIFCCRNSYAKAAACRSSVYSRVFKDACPDYFSYAYDSPAPVVRCRSKEYVITFCPSRWGEQYTDRSAQV